MARHYPRFLFSNPQNTKSKGPFIVHTLEPRIIFKISTDFNEWEDATFAVGFDFKKPGTDHFMILLDEHPKEEDINKWTKIAEDAGEWYVSQIKSKSIIL